MVVIRILFPPGAGSKPIVMPFDARARPGEAVIWHVESLNPEARQFEISFQDGKDAFFSGKTDSGKLPMEGRLYDISDIYSAMGDGVASGRAPKSLPKGTECKYSISSWDQNGTIPGPGLDPKIIIDEP